MWRESLIAKLHGLDASAAAAASSVSATVSVPSGTTLLWLIEHMAQAERTVDDAIAAYRRAAQRTGAIVTGAEDMDRMCATTGTESPVSLRWVLAHRLEETARHAGHADIFREMIDGKTGR